MNWDPPAEGGESHFDTLLRSLVISRLGRAEDPEVRAEAKRRFDLHATGVMPIKADIRSARLRTQWVYLIALDQRSGS